MSDHLRRRDGIELCMRRRGREVRMQLLRRSVGAWGRLIHEPGHLLLLLRASITKHRLRRGGMHKVRTVVRRRRKVQWLSVRRHRMGTVVRRPRFSIIPTVCHIRKL
jgi:hypothetical protein